MNAVSVFGLGYVGSVLGACLADNGHHVIGVDANPMKVAEIAEGRSPIVERGLEELVKKAVESGLLRAIDDEAAAVWASEMSIICVGTPSSEDGSPDLNYVTTVCKQIGSALKRKTAYHIVIVRSTLLPGTTEGVVIPILERSSGKQAGVDFGVCFNPEFLREGTSIEDFYNPPVTVIGTDDDRVAEQVRALYSMLSAPVAIVPFKVAEMVKYVNNAFHALKVCFANEIGNICRRQQIDSHQVMQIFCMDNKLNLSPYYLKPGFAFGGSCLPKDIRGILHRGRHLDLSLPVLEAILPSNTNQIQIACSMVERSGRKRVGVCGLSFKPGTDDLRESPMVRLIEYLLGKGYPVKVFDENVSIARLHGTNRAYIDHVIPHIACLMTDSADTIVETSDIIVIGTRSDQIQQALASGRADQTIIDLVHIPLETLSLNGNYQGICW